MKKIFSILFILMSFAATAQQKHITLRASIDTAYFLTQEHFFNSLDSLVATLGGGGGGGITQLTGDVTAGPGSGSQVATIGTNKVLDAMIRQSAGLSVIGNSTNSTANVADITAGTAWHVLRRDGSSTLGFGTLNAASLNATYSNTYIPQTDGSGNITWIAPGTIGAWNVTGNTGTTPANFAGTIDSVGFRLKAHNKTLILLDSSHTSNQSNIQFFDPAFASTANGNIRYNTNQVSFSSTNQTNYMVYSSVSSTNLTTLTGFLTANRGLTSTSLVIATTASNTAPRGAEMTSQSLGVISAGQQLFGFGRIGTITHGTSSGLPYNTYSSFYDSLTVGNTFSPYVTKWGSLKIVKRFGGNTSDTLFGIQYDPTLAVTPNKNYAFVASSGQIGFGTLTPHASALVDNVSTTQGVTFPTMTQALRDVIGSPKLSLTIYCSDCTATDASTGVLQTYNGATWKNHW